MTAPGLVRRALRRAQVDGGYSRAGVIGTVLVVLVAATCVRLGFWQLDRLEQRRARNALVQERMAQPAVDVAQIAADSATASYRRLRLDGSCDGEPIVLAGRSRHGAPGVHLLCRFHTTNGAVVLLDRGWLPSADARSVDPALLAHAPSDTVVDALAVPYPPGDDAIEPGEARVVYRLNRAQGSVLLGTPAPPWYAQALGSNDALPIPADPPELGNGPHLGYVVQWFSFAAIALGGWLVLFRRRRRDEANS